MLSKQHLPLIKYARALSIKGERFLPLAGYLLLSLAVLWPALPYFGSAVPGGPVAAIDSWQNIWNLWWMRKALAAGMNPFHSPYLYHPEGVDLYLQTLNPSNGMLAMPITALFGPIAGYNAAVLLAFVLTGVAGYALALRVTGSRTAAFVGGLVLTFSPFHMTKVWDGQLELIALQWTAFYALFLLRAAEDGKRRDALLAGCFLALIGYTSWYYFLFFTVYSLLFALIWLALAPGWRRRRTMLLQLLLAGAWGCLLLTPLLLPALQSVAGSTAGQAFDASDPLDLILLHSADLLDPVMPSYLHPVWGQLSADIARPWHPWIGGWNIALGYTTMALAIFAGVVAWRSAWRWWVLTIVSLVLSLGPVLHVAGQRTKIHLPYALLFELPGAGIARRPGHFITIAVVLLAPLAALGLQHLLERTPRAKRPLLLATVLLLLAFEYAPPLWPLHRASVPAYYATIKGSEGALLELPPRNERSEPLQAQIVHKMPILGGYVSRTPPYPIAQHAPGIRQLWQLQPDQHPPLIAGPDLDLQALNFYGVRKLVVHWAEVAHEDRQGLQKALEQVIGGVAPSYADGRLTAYAVPEVDPQPFAYLAEGWHSRESDGTKQWRWMRSQGEIVLINPARQAIPVALQLSMHSYRIPRAVTLALDSTELGRRQISTAGTRLALHLALPPGEHRLTLQAPVAQEQGGNRELSIGLTTGQLQQ